MSPLDKVLDKLSKLKAAQDGEAALGNTAAAEAFAGMINAMLLKHELSIEDVKVRPDEDPIVELLVKPTDHGIKFSRVRIGWQEALARIVGEAHLCKFLVTSGTNFITFVGTKAHASVAEYAYVVLVNAAEGMSRKARDEYWKAHRHDEDFESGNFRAAWLSGFIERIAQRFAEARRAEVQAAPVGASTALVRLEGALVRSKNYLDEKYKRKASAVHVGYGCSAGRDAGRKAADGMAIGRKGVSTSQKMLR